MRLDDWLDSRTPAPPHVLGRRMREVLGESAAADADGAPELLLAAGERLLTAILETGCRDRTAALDLLAADALVTYALEAGCEHPDRLAEQAKTAMIRIAALVPAGPS